MELTRTGKATWSVPVLLLVLFGGGLVYVGLHAPREASLPQGGTSYVQRNFITANAFTDQPFEVELRIVPGPKTLSAECPADQVGVCNDYYVVDEQIPLNLPVTSLAGTDCSLTTTTPKRIVCVVLQDTTARLVQYTLALPSATQTLTFGGTYMFQGDTGINTISGVTSRSIIPDPGCTPNWVPGAWGAWSNASYNCGTRTRPVTDAAGCGITNDPNQPATTETTTCITTPNICGNNVQDGTEVCDGADLNGQDCLDMGSVYLGGNLSCLPTCTGYDKNQCTVKGACAESWQCDPWTACAAGLMTRTCLDRNACLTPVNTPETTLSCTAGTPAYLVYVAIGAALLMVGVVALLTRRIR